MKLLTHPHGNYQFLTGIAPYSSGVIALPGFEIIHITLRRPVPYRQGFEQIDRHFRDAGRSRKALCSIELRLPAPLSFQGFADFNADYQQLLSSWGLLLDGLNPLARTNIAPAVSPPQEPSLYAFAYTVPCALPTMPSFVVAGAGDLRDQADLTPAAIVCPGETSVAALRAKASTVMNVMQARVEGLGLGWADVTRINIYTIFELQAYMVDTVLDRVGGAACHGVHWHYGNPPIAGLAYEMDVRSVRKEYIDGTI